MLTEEQKETIRKNRERALEIQMKRKIQRENNVGSKVEVSSEEDIVKKRRIESEVADSDELEEFEVNASKYVTQKEAKQMYCLPDGTLAVCPFVEKENPRGRGFKPMKLYCRVEIRRRARERFGGLAGLITERKRREEKRFHKDLESTKNIFR